MIGLIDAGWNGEMALADDIKNIGKTWRNKHGEKKQTIELRDGRTLDKAERQIEDLCARPIQIIPAVHGTYLLTIDPSAMGEDCIASERPVIAWALCLDGEVRPVTPAGVLDKLSIHGEHYVEMPGEPEIHAASEFTEPREFQDRTQMRRHFSAAAKLDAMLAERSELERLIAEYVATGKALEAAANQGLPDGNQLERAYLAATVALDSYEPHTFEDLARSLAARFSDDAPPTDSAVAEIVRHARRLVGEGR